MFENQQKKKSTKHKKCMKWWYRNEEPSGTLKHKECMNRWYSLQDSANLNFPALFLFSSCSTKSVENSKWNSPKVKKSVRFKMSKIAGKFKSPKSCSEYHRFIHSLCFSVPEGSALHYNNLLRRCLLPKENPSFPLFSVERLSFCRYRVSK